MKKIARQFPDSLIAWFWAMRPFTLGLSFAAAACGHILAWQEHCFSAGTAFLGILTAVLLQVLSNFANDYGDAMKNTDNQARLGARRMVSAGYITPRAMRYGMGFVLVLVVLSGSLLLFQVALVHGRFPWQLGVFGVLSIWAAVAYTVGKKPYGYWGAGDLAVLIFFGYVAVVGSYFLQTAVLNLAIFLPASAIGLWCVAVLNVNNMRDRVNDEVCQKMTVAVRLGEKNMFIYHFVIMNGATFFWSLYLWQNSPWRVAIVLIVLAQVFSLGHLRQILWQKNALIFNQELKNLSLGILFQVALLLIVPSVMVFLV